MRPGRKLLAIVVASLAVVSLAWLLPFHCVLTSSGALALGVAIARRRLLRRLRQVSAVAAAVAAGDDLSRRVRLSGSDDVAKLGRAIDTMLEHVQRSRNAARAREEQHRSIVDNISEAVFKTDEDGRLCFVNSAWERITGTSAASSLGRWLGDFVALDDFAIPQVSGGGACGGDAVRCSAPLLCATRAAVWLQVHVRAIRGPGGECAGWTGTLADVTEQHLLEEQHARAREEALEASRVKSEFVANVSHEIRTPMNGVIGMLALLAETELEPEQRQYTETALGSAEALLAILNDVLDFSKIEAGKMAIEPGPCNLLRLVEDVADLVAPGAQAKGLELFVSYPATVPHQVVADGHRLRQVLVNIVGNAVKFTERGHVLIEVRQEAEQNGVVGVAIGIEDTGIGIPVGKLDSIFGAFTQVDAAASRRHAGTGLGLAITRRLVDLMGGTIDVASHLDIGSRFTVRLNLRRDPEAMDTRRPASRRALILDAIPLGRQVLEEQLEAAGCQVVACGSLADAVAALDGGARPDLVVCVDHPQLGAAAAGRALTARCSGGDLVALVSAADAHLGEWRDAGFGRVVGRPSRRSDWLPREGTVVQGRERALEWRGLRVLVVDDNSTNRVVIQHMLQRRGCRVDLVSNGLEAVRLCAFEHYDLVLMDCQLPGIDGYETTRRIRQQDRTVGATRRIVAFTAHAMRGDRERCLEAGMDGYLSKPVRPQELDSMLRQQLGSRREEPQRIFDRAGLLARVEGDEALLAQLVRVFLDDSADWPERCRGALGRGEHETVRRLAHSLRGAAANLCARTLADAAAAFEETVRAGAAPGVAPALESCAAALAAARSALQSIALTSGECI